MVERVDAVVIGGGLGGLAAAVTLAGQGRRTVVLEQQTVAGGYAAGFKRGPYRFDAALHALYGLAPGGGLDELFRELEIWDRLRLHRLDPLYVLRGGGRMVTAHADPFHYEAELIRNFPDQADGIRDYLDEAMTLYRESRHLQADSSEGRSSDFAHFAARYPTLVRASGETFDEAMRRHVSDPHARTALGALWVYFGLPPSQLSALVGGLGTAGYLEHGGWYPEGGSQAISEALVEVLAERGGEIRYGQLVDHVEVSTSSTAGQGSTSGQSAAAVPTQRHSSVVDPVETTGGRAVAVTTAEGHRIEADLFISNASAPTTMLEMVGREHLPHGYVEKVDRPSSSYTTFSVFLGLERDVFAEQGLPHELFLYDELDADAAWEASRRGDWAHASLAATDYTRVDPGCAPPGDGAVVLTTVATWDHEDTWGTGGDLARYHENARYLELKEQVADALVERADEAIPGLREAIRFRESSTPLTNFHYTRNPHGAIEGYENSPEFSGPGWLSQRTPVDNLFLAGAWTSSGGMTACIASGRSAAQKAMQTVPAHVPA